MCHCHRHKAVSFDSRLGVFSLICQPPHARGSVTVFLIDTGLFMLQRRIAIKRLLFFYHGIAWPIIAIVVVLSCTSTTYDFDFLLEFEYR